MENNLKVTLCPDCGIYLRDGKEYDDCECGFDQPRDKTDLNEVIESLKFQLTFDNIDFAHFIDIAQLGQDIQEEIKTREK